VGAGRLAEIAVALDVRMEVLLQGVRTIKRKTQQDDDPLALLSSSQALRLARAFSKIANSRIRIALVGLAEGVASGGRWRRPARRDCGRCGGSVRWRTKPVRRAGRRGHRNRGADARSPP